MSVVDAVAVPSLCDSLLSQENRNEVDSGLGHRNRHDDNADIAVLFCAMSSWPKPDLHCRPPQRTRKNGDRGRNPLRLPFAASLSLFVFLSLLLQPFRCKSAKAEIPLALSQTMQESLKVNQSWIGVFHTTSAQFSCVNRMDCC